MNINLSELIQQRNITIKELILKKVTPKKGGIKKTKKTSVQKTLLNCSSNDELLSMLDTLGILPENEQLKKEH